MAKQQTTTDGLNDVTDMLGGGEYLKTKDVEHGDLTFGIARVEKVTFEAKGDRAADKKVVLTFEGDPVKKLSLNQPNLQTLFEAWGKDATRWTGLMLDCYFDRTVRDPGGRLTGGVRVRARSKPAVVAQIGAGPNGSGPTTTAPHEEEIPFWKR